MTTGRAKGRAQRAGPRVWPAALCPLPRALLWFALLPFALTMCNRGAPAAKPTARSLVLVTIDTLRADHVGAYGWSRARTPTLDALARRGVVFDRAYAAAPITLPSHATLLTGRYPPGHGARDNGARVRDGVPTLATALHAAGFRTAAFVAAFPLDHQFGLNRGFDVYSDHLPRAPDGRPMNERPAAQVVDEAVGWLSGTRGQAPGTTTDRFFLWVHVFEPHAPYGDPSSGRPVLERYDDEIATADREIGRLAKALAPHAGDTLVIVAGDHGEAFGEHGEHAHSIFVYDTTLRVPLIITGPGIPDGRRVSDPVTLADIAPTTARTLGVTLADVDGMDLTPALAGGTLPGRELYAESFAPLVEFGWAPLRAVRSGPWKFIAAPKPELYDVEKDTGEQANLASAQEAVAHQLDQRVGRYSGAILQGPSIQANPAAAERLRALGYSAGSRRDEGGNRPDPKDRRELAARMAQVTAGELTGSALVTALEAIVRDDPRNGQAHLRLGYARLESGDCARAEPEFHASIASGLPSADAHLGLATCLGRRNDLAGAERALTEARRLEPDNPVILANVGILQAAKGDTAAAISSLKNALAADPDLLEARFNLAIAYARAGRRSDAATAARELLARLPATAPQRQEVERLLRTVQ
jgi:choline-sulfatase